MALSKLTPEQRAALGRKIDRLVDGMDDDQRGFFYEHPDALRHVFAGGLQEYFEKMRARIPPSGLTSYAMDDAAGWKALEDGRALMSVTTRGLLVDYRPDRDALFTSNGIFDDPDDTEDLEDMMERRRIFRAGGAIVRRVKRLVFPDDVSRSEIEGVIRLRGWKTVDARTLLVWCTHHRKEIEPQETVAASTFPKLRRDGRTIVLTSGVTRKQDRKGPFLGFKRDDAGQDALKRVFDGNHSFLVEVPDDRSA